MQFPPRGLKRGRLLLLAGVVHFNPIPVRVSKIDLLDAIGPEFNGARGALQVFDGNHSLHRQGRPSPKPSGLERKKETHQEILNEISSLRLKKLRGELVDKREVEFVVSTAIITLRAQLLRLPLLVVAELRELNHDQLHAIRMRAERAVHAFLEETSEALIKAIDPRSAIAELEEEDSNGEVTRAKQDALARKRSLANAKRRAKRKAKATK